LPAFDHIATGGHCEPRGGRLQPSNLGGVHAAPSGFLPISPLRRTIDPAVDLV